jgi:2-polyprenyl-3-methyl-5-hydroxy-6-metoxy-1,4-benzoquinol methylase
MSQEHAVEVASGKRFEFGKNWQSFLQTVDEAKIADAERSLSKMLGVPSLEGKTFLDIGSGSGLFSLAARRLGAKVHSFDFDPNSVACTQELRRRYFPDDRQWTVEQGSALDRDFLAKLGKFDVVYSWGVLHHTGQMWRALENAGLMVAPNGLLFIAIYNDEGKKSRRWTWVKQNYNRSKIMRGPLLAGSMVHLYWRRMVKDFITLHPFRSLRNYDNSSSGRGMNWWYDLVDWVGGYPFEVAKPEELFQFYHDRNFELIHMVTTRDLGCNEVVFRKKS